MNDPQSAQAPRSVQSLQSAQASQTPRGAHDEFVRIGRMRHKLKNQLLVLLPKIYESGIYKKYASSIYEYGARFGDLSRYAIETRLRLEPNLVGKPCLKAAILQVGVKKVAMVAKLATPETEEIFAEKIVNMNKSSIQTLSKELRQVSEVTEITKDMVVKCEAKPENIRLELDDEMTFLFLKLKKKYGENLSNKEVMRRVLVAAGGGCVDFADAAMVGEVERSGCKSLPGQTFALPAGADAGVAGGDVDGDVAGPAGGVSPKKYVNAALKKKVRERSRGKCEYNNCNKPAEHFHHTGRFSENHSHEGVIHVCKEHHQILHNGFVENEGDDPREWRLTLGRPLGYADDCYRKCREKALGR